MSRLLVLTGPDAGREFPVRDGELSIGRHEANQIVLTDPQVSRRHGVVRLDGQSLTISDLGSGNGTKVGGQNISQATIKSGERFLLGDSTILFLGSGAKPPGIVRTLPSDAGSVLMAKPQTVTNDWLRSRLAHLGVLYEASQATSEILDVDELLGRLLDLAMRTTGADCGSIYLNDAESGEWLPHVERLAKSKHMAISRTIVEYVKREKLGVLATDAGLDERFAGGESIATHQIREVIAAPMKGRHDIVGVIVLETFAKPQSLSGSHIVFSEDHLTLAMALAHQAALAVEETRYYLAMLNAGQLAAVGQAMASLSHDIKNIMHGVRFGSDLVRKGLADDDREMLSQGWRLVERNQDRIDSLIHNMLGYSKSREPLRESCDVVAIIKDVMESMRGKANDAGIDMGLSVHDESQLGTIVSCDRDGITRALLNIASNAIDAIDKKGRVDFSLTMKESQVQIRVTDNGPGIVEGDRESIFEPFVSRKGHRGTGLGLPVSRKILREHGGDLTLESVDIGTQFLLKWSRT